MQRVGRKVAPEGSAMDDWRIAAELALRLGTDFDLETVDEVTDEIARVAPAFAGVDRRRCCASARDGVVLPLREHRDEIVLRAGGLSILADDGPGASWDPIQVDGEPKTRGRADGRRRSEPTRTPSAPRPSRRASRSALWDRDGSGPTRGARPRRVRSAPRGRPHALRRRTRRQRRRRRSRGLVRGRPAAS